jgi:hypothetical protein
MFLSKNKIMDVRKRRLDTAGRAMIFLLDAKKEGNEKEYKIHLRQLEKMKIEFGIHYDIEKGKVFYPK